jgi:hypothetical protein
MGVRESLLDVVMAKELRLTLRRAISCSSQKVDSDFGAQRGCAFGEREKHFVTKTVELVTPGGKLSEPVFEFVTFYNHLCKTDRKS